MGNINVCYNDKLPSLPPHELAAGDSADDLSLPFCCGAVAPYKARQLKRDAVFSAFAAGRGHHPNLYCQGSFGGFLLRAAGLGV